MRKNIFNIIFKFIFISSISGLILVWVYNLKNPGQEYRLKDNKYQFINFGNSHASFFQYKLFGLKGINVSIPGNSPYYFNSQYQFYQKNLEESAIVTITLSYYSFGIESGLVKEAKFNNQFYFYLKPELIRNYKLSKHLDLINNVLSQNVFSLIKGEKIMSIDKLENNNEKPKFQFYAYSKNIAYNYKQINADRIKRENYITDFHMKLFNPSHVDENVKVLSQMIKDAKERGYKPVLVTPPYSQGYSEKFPAKWLANNFYKNINELTEEFNIPHIDYSKSTKFHYNGLFNDPQHMNRYGKTIFTRILLDSLSELDYIENNILLNKKEQYDNFKVDNELILKSVESYNINDSKKVFIFLFNKNLKEYYNSQKVKLVFVYDGKRIEKVISEINESFINLYVYGKVSNFSFSFEKNK